MATELTGVGAIYRRVSTDRQDAERQRDSIERWLTRKTVSVVPENIYEDIGWSRHEADTRPAFQRLLRDAAEGRINWIIVDRQDRFGTADKFQLFHYLHLLRKARVKLYTVDEKEMTSNQLVASLITHLDADQSERELTEKSIRTLEGMREHAKVGEYMGGHIPFGMNVCCFAVTSAGLIERWRVKIVGRNLRIKTSIDGTQKRYDGEGNFPASENDEILQLRPTDDQADLNLIQQVFERYATESVSEHGLSRWLNDTGTKPQYTDQWEHWHVRSMLANTVYLGQPAWNKSTQGAYTEFKGGERHAKEGKQWKSHAVEDWVKPEPLFQPVVEPSLFQRVQEKLMSINRRRRAPRSQELWFSGLLFCGGCGQRMRGIRRPKSGATYICATYADACRHDITKCKCGINSILHETVEACINQYLEDTGRQLAGMVDAMDVTTNDKPAAFKKAIMQAAEAHQKMCERIKAEYVVNVEGGAKPDSLHLPTDEEGVWQMVPINETGELERMYRCTFEGEESDITNQLDGLHSQQEELIETVKKISGSSPRSLMKVQAQLDQVDAAIAEAEGKLVNAADLFRHAEEECARLHQDWEAARKALSGEITTRRKAEAVRRVISRINLSFESTGKFRPSTRLVSFEIVPVDGGSSIRNGASVSQGPISDSQQSSIRNGPSAQPHQIPSPRRRC